MALSAVKTWIAEVLTFGDLNAEFNNIYANGEDLSTPATKSHDMAGFEFVLDADSDTSITADTDDQIDVKVGGTDVLVITGTTLTWLGSQVITQRELRDAEAAIFRVSTLEARMNALPNSTVLESQVFR